MEFNIETYFVQINIADREPLADEDDDGSAEAVHTALVEAADAGDLAQVLGACATEKPLVSGAKKSGI